MSATQNSRFLTRVFLSRSASVSLSSTNENAFLSRSSSMNGRMTLPQPGKPLSRQVDLEVDGVEVDDGRALLLQSGAQKQEGKAWAE